MYDCIARFESITNPNQMTQEITTRPEIDQDRTGATQALRLDMVGYGIPPHYVLKKHELFSKIWNCITLYLNTENYIRTLHNTISW